MTLKVSNVIEKLLDDYTMPKVSYKRNAQMNMEYPLPARYWLQLLQAVGFVSISIMSRNPNYLHNNPKD